ncbi:hypothetical protein C7B65_12815 [Phormidesmis priestleyi ULC007]|uniref:Uncharacterized protein n=1 Tax=Phormidesmis priestleyi ULC007 TaxID=1920490 RepID=A0A2T1DFC0_9CYAN|nr:hypothetical protein [Phormidesmis priestleyi]PSB19153.1 hypothetical protein C7B65_12815 [Phormidesmis priestleyi ULC007]PZO50005.1 MAG: hypothetical protein DCF14_12760 [Phormidesmis priestleyi]
MKIATGLTFGAVGAYAFSQGVSNFTQSSHFQPELDVQSIVAHASAQSLNKTIAPAIVKFNPEPNPEPIGTGGTGTR